MTRSYSAQVFDEARGKWKELSRFETEADAANYAKAMHLRWPACFTDHRAEPSSHYYNAKFDREGGLVFVDMRRQSVAEIMTGSERDG